jgi:hypothetical protein
LEVVRAFAPLVVAFFAGVFSVWLFRVTAPVLSLGVEGQWVGERADVLLLRLTIENRSRVVSTLGECRVQVLEHQYQAMLSEWVPFEEATVKPAEAPAKWVAPHRVENPPEHVYPGEKVTIELLRSLPNTQLVHVGFQISQRLGRWRLRLAGQPIMFRNTATAWIARGIERAA